ncbi:ABC transporter substrate-binding protein [Verminephrobacter eiseniae]|uniref:ABC transporter substrate-binding protein n=1 Tax=Verminephrobacter eiseniae TaxID=364317 RepID=UPI00223892B7|nr:ABC transporter substrate-binding protein [Verminephrobacter eiseniae]MCW5261708.1 ABC transporter substrate-binding protein [Verminephrobacter eiseniae]MCW5286862.1 ABC transporter substrate-binding protein [Verminephrobacter eiseniae]MCW5305159.1 ABC transporter substrate-binding protein [Verminephrobacter eiseniae]MCW8182723.1 ABC transporter substrate-binding protein [Verminephrobacter eiseniae]MCW8191205.1 ABC transporter substrate-binding protein [Verminephrobacter eiseniae]
MKLLPAVASVAALFILGMGAANAQACKSPVPDAVLVKKGTLIMSVNPTLPPMQFVDQTGALKGMRVELGEAIAKRLCLTPEYVRIEFSAMIPGLQAGRWDIINTGIFYTDERAKLMQMLPYEDQAISISTARGNPLKINKPEDLSGKSIGVEIGGFEERKARELDKQLTDKGLKGMTIRTFENFAMAFQSLRAGQVEVALSIDSTGAEYQKRGDFDRVLHGLFPTPVALAAKNKELSIAVAKVLNDMKADGSLNKLLDQYGVKATDGAVLVKGPAS